MAAVGSGHDMVLRMLADTNQYLREIRKAQTATHAFRDAVAGAARFIRDTMSTAFGVLGGNLLTGAVSRVTGMMTGFVKSGFELAASIETTQIQFETMLGSAEKSKDLMRGLLWYANRTAFEFKDVADAARVIAGAGVSSGQIMPTLKMLGEMSNLGEEGGLGQIAQLYAKIFARGRITGEELRQFANTGKPVIDFLAKVRGTSKEQVFLDSEKGLLGLRDFQRALVEMTGAGGPFFKMQERLSKTLSGMWSTLKDSFAMAGAELANSLVEIFDLKGEMDWGTRLGEALKGWIREITPWLKQAWKWIREESAQAFWNASAAVANFGAKFLEVIQAVVNGLGQIPARLELIGLQASLLWGRLTGNKEPLSKAELMRFGELSGRSAAGLPLAPDIMNTNQTQTQLRLFSVFAKMQALTKNWLPASMRSAVEAKAAGEAPKEFASDTFALAAPLATPAKAGDKGDRDVLARALSGREAYEAIYRAMKEQLNAETQERIAKGVERTAEDTAAIREAAERNQIVIDDLAAALAMGGG